LTREQEQLKTVGDASRITKSIEENEEKLQLIGHVNFVISPLVAEAAAAMKNSNLEKTVNISCTVLDECVRLSPAEVSSKSLLMGDSGLRKFIGLFEYLGGNVEEEKLALGYVGLTGHMLRPINFGEAVSYLTDLVNSLYNIGAIRPDIKEGIDDHLNFGSMKETEEAFAKNLAEEPDLRFDTPSEEPTSGEVDDEEDGVLSTAKITEEQSDGTDEVVEEMLISNLEEETPASPVEEAIDDSLDGMVVGSVIAHGCAIKNKKKKRKSREVEKFPVLEDYVHPTGESGSAGV
jgi:hypothetical protein